MSLTQLYRDQAIQQDLHADAADLQNVRERCERAANAWRALAKRSERGDATRAELAARKLLDTTSETPDRVLAAAALAT